MWLSFKEYVKALGKWMWIELIGHILTVVMVGFDLSDTTQITILNVSAEWACIGWVVFSVFSLIIAPFIIFHRIRVQRDELKEALATKTQHQLALVELAQLRTEGVRLRNEGWYHTPKEKDDEWWQDVERWLQTVGNIMACIHPADSDNWRTLGNVLMRGWGIGINRPEMDRRLSMLTQWFERLEVYINERTRQ